MCHSHVLVNGIQHTSTKINITDNRVIPTLSENNKQFPLKSIYM